MLRNAGEAHLRCFIKLAERHEDLGGLTEWLLESGLTNVINTAFSCFMQAIAAGKAMPADWRVKANTSLCEATDRVCETLRTAVPDWSLRARYLVQVRSYLSGTSYSSGAVSTLVTAALALIHYRHADLFLFTAVVSREACEFGPASVAAREGLQSANLAASAAAEAVRAGLEGALPVDVDIDSLVESAQIEQRYALLMLDCDAAWRQYDTHMKESEDFNPQQVWDSVDCLDTVYLAVVDDEDSMARLIEGVANGLAALIYDQALKIPALAHNRANHAIVMASAQGSRALRDQWWFPEVERVAEKVVAVVPVDIDPAAAPIIEAIKAAAVKRDNETMPDCIKRFLNFVYTTHPPKNGAVVGAAKPSRRALSLTLKNYKPTSPENATFAATNPHWAHICATIVRMADNLLENSGASS
eukprot:Amastigsp_a174631_13.p1 type:complete len:416 gc:universal Amastigsp_a174631_13:1351-104(-)